MANGDEPTTFEDLLPSGPPEPEGFAPNSPTQASLPTKIQGGALGRPDLLDEEPEEGDEGRDFTETRQSTTGVSQQELPEDEPFTFEDLAPPTERPDIDEGPEQARTATTRVAPEVRAGAPPEREITSFEDLERQGLPRNRDQARDITWFGPWKRGAKSALQMSSDAAEWMKELNTQLIDAPILNKIPFHEFGVKARGSGLAIIEHQLQQMANDIEAPERPDWLRHESYLDPVRIYNTIGEGGPLLAGYAVASIANPAAGGALMLGLEGGQTDKYLERYEQETGEQLPEWQKNLTAITVGSANAALEYLGINRILKAARVPGLKQRLITTGLGAGWEGITETGQELNQILAEAFTEGGMDAIVEMEVPENTGQRLAESMYGGLVLGAAGSGAAAAIGAGAAQRTDAEVAAMTVPEDGGAPEPVFRVTRTGHPREGDVVSLQELQQEGLTPEPYQRQLFQSQIQHAGFSREQAEAATFMVEAHATNKGMSLEEYLDKSVNEIRALRPETPRDIEKFGDNLIPEIPGSQYGNMGQLLIEFADGSQTQTDLVSGMFEMFERSMSSVERGAMRKQFGIEEFTQESIQKVSQRFEEWLKQGGDPQSDFHSTFENFSDWLVKVYARTGESDRMSLELTDEQVDFFNNLFERKIDRVINRRGRDRTTGIAKAWDWLMDVVDIEKKYRDAGFPEVGFRIKNQHSEADAHIKQGARTLFEASNAVNGDSDLLTEAYLIAESQERMNQLAETDGNEGLKQAVGIMRNYFDQSLAQYQQLGGLQKGFKQRLVDEIDEKLAEIEETGKARVGQSTLSRQEVQQLEDLRHQLAEAQDIEFTHVPYSWFESQLANPQNFSRILDVLEARNVRQVNSIQSLIDEGVITREDVKVEEAFQSYAHRKGRDMALLKLRDAAVREGAAVSVRGNETAPPGKEHISGFTAPLFEGYAVDKTLKNWINEATKPYVDEGGVKQAWRNFWNATKMAAFWNPFFLPMYDVVQASMAGAINPLKPIGTMKTVKSAFLDVFNHSPEYQAALEGGKDSTPFPSWFEHTDTDFLAAKLGGKYKSRTIGRIENDLKRIFTDDHTGDIFQAPDQIAGKLFSSMYQASWDIAWTLDDFVRQITYRHFRDNENLGPREAAQRAATAHGDYASVPPDTRRKLNQIFFTPTFKIAMAKFFGQSLRSAQSVLTGDRTATEIDKAGVLIRTGAIMLAFDQLMLALGFDRDEFGIRYRRPGVQTPQGTVRDLVVNWSSPHNLWLKYMNRIRGNMTDPTVTNQPLDLINSFQWEFHPIYRTAWQVFSNNSGGGQRIYSPLDPNYIKYAKSLDFATEQIVTMYRQIAGESIEQRGREVFAEEFGRLNELMTRPFVFRYTQETLPERAAADIDYLTGLWNEEISGRRISNMIIEGATQEELDQEITALDARNQELQKRIREVIDRMNEYTYEYPTQEMLMPWEAEVPPFDQTPDMKDPGDPATDGPPEPQSEEEVRTFEDLGADRE